MKHTKFLAFLMSLGLLISVTGCSAGGNSSEQSSKSSSTSTTQAAEAAKSDFIFGDVIGNKGVTPSDEEVEFLHEIQELADSAKKVDELKKSLLDYERINEVLVFKNSEESKNIELQINEGEVINKETYVKIFYDNSESWIAFTIYK